MIFGRWTPLGSVAAALLFGFAASLAIVLSSLNVPLPSNFLLMTPVRGDDHRGGRPSRQGTGRPPPTARPYVKA